MSAEQIEVTFEKAALKGGMKKQSEGTSGRGRCLCFMG